MNVIISNKYQPLLSSLEIDVIKSMNGEFLVDDIVETFRNFYYNKMILDITALIDYKNIDTIQKLSIGIDMSKVILLLDDSPESFTNSYLSQLISMGIYNFTRNKDGIMYLYEHPNTYKDVAHIQQLNPAMGNLSVVGNNQLMPESIKVIGIKNITEHAGSTTLTYLLKRQLEQKYRVIAIEADKHDFLYFNDKTLTSVSSDDLAKEIMKHSDVDVILVDLNTADENICNELIFLMEPSTIKLNKMMLKNRKVFEELRNRNIVLNQSLLDNKDIGEFEYEAKTSVFFNLPPLNDKGGNLPILDAFLNKLGFIKLEVDTNTQKNNIFGLFKF